MLGGKKDASISMEWSSDPLIRIKEVTKFWGEDLESDGGQGAIVVGCTFLGGSGGMPPQNLFKFEPSESGSEAFRDSFEVLEAVVLQTDS